jgi:hypothetical protein
MDPGLLTLGALTFGATALLSRFRKTQKEGFDTIPTGDYPEVVNTAQELYNRFTLSSDPRQEATRVAQLDPATQQAYRAAADSALTTIQANLNVPGVVTVTQSENQNPVYIPDENSIFTRSNFCETKDINSDVFNDPKFVKNCGVCFSSGTTNTGKQFKGPKGLFIEELTKKQYLDKQQADGTTYSLSKPSLGSCEGATGGVGHDYSFAVNKKEFDAYSQRFRCKHDRVLDGTCAVCLQDGSYTYAGPKNSRELDVVSFFVAGVGTLKVSIGGREVEFTNKAKSLTLNASSPSKFSARVNEGDAMTFTVDNPDGQSEFYGIMEAPTTTGGVNQIPLDKILLTDDVNNAKPRRSKRFEVVATPSGSITVPKLISVYGKPNMILSGTLPFLFVGNAPFEGIDCKASILQSKPSSLEIYGGDPCYKPSSQGPGTWSDECLRSRITDFGCTQDGNLFKNPNELRNLSLVDLQKKVQEYAGKQYTDAASSKQCNGKNISTPCDPFVAYNVNETPDINLQCLEYLYYNRGAENPAIGPTYSGPTNTFYTLDNTGKKIYCLQNAKNDPRLPGNINTYNKYARNGYKGQLGLKAVQTAMNESFLRATNTSLNANLPDSQGGRSDAIRSCFLNLAQVPDTPLASNTLPNGRYLRVRFPNTRKNVIQISQIAVFDNRNVNVAQGKPTTAANKLAADCGPERAVDGQLASRWHPMEYHSTASGNDFWQVDFGREYPIKEVVYFNRADCCQSRATGMLLELLKADGNTVVWSVSLKGSRSVERFLTFAKSFNI